VIARTLAHRIVMRTAGHEAFRAIRFLDCDPDIAAGRTVESVLTIEPFRGRYRILEEGIVVEEAIGTRSVTDYLHFRIFAHSLAARPRAAILHAASLRRGGRRVLIAGAATTGKTTLALRLLRAGYDFEGDEHVFLEGDGVVARPRACRVKESSLALLSDIAEAISSAPAYVDDLGCTIFNVDPRTIGGAWRIEKGDVDCVIVLRRNHGGYSSLRPMQPIALAQALVSEMGLREIDRGVSIGAVAALVGRAKGFDLSLGDLETAVMCVHRALDE
jgi:hypothetical protein